MNEKINNFLNYNVGQVEYVTELFMKELMLLHKVGNISESLSVVHLLHISK
jgi:hypothetical protein